MNSTDTTDLTLLVCTFNRSTDLGELLETAIRQNIRSTFTYEVLVVDNNSTDNTRDVVMGFMQAGHRQVRYLFEGRQGKSNALNAGLAAARGWAYAIVDDDFLLPANWVETIAEAFSAHPDVSFVSGKVLPYWQAPAPRWLTNQHWSALALADYGDQAFFADPTRPICLLACAFRRDHVEAVGGYRADLGVSINAIGGVEDLDILQRLWKAGRRGIYLPHMSFKHKVQPTRLTKSYHRRWHSGHGRFYAALRDPDFEQSKARLFDIPSHVYHEAARRLFAWLRCAIRGAAHDAFAHETRLRFLFGFARARRRAFVEAGGGTIGDFFAFARAILSKRL